MCSEIGLEFYLPTEQQLTVSLKRIESVEHQPISKRKFQHGNGLFKKKPESCSVKIRELSCVSVCQVSVESKSRKNVQEFILLYEHGPLIYIYI